MLRGKTALAYAAGIVDGEGCISIHKKSRLTESGRSTCPVNITLRVSVSNTNEWLCRWFRLQFGGSVFVHNAKKEKWKPGWQWNLQGKRGHICKLNARKLNLLSSFQLRKEAIIDIILKKKQCYEKHNKCL